MQFTQIKYYKALFLLLVFSMNSVVSFACSFSNLFHSFHHHQVAADTEHKHSGNHHHNKNQEAQHQENEVAGHHHDTRSQKSENDDCCSDKVVEIEKIEKAVSRTITAPDAIFITSLFISYNELYSRLSRASDLLQHNIRWRHPATIPDLRIVIQSFQI